MVSHGYHGYHLIEGKGVMALFVHHMAPMATTNAAATSLDSKWTPQRQFHTAWRSTRMCVNV